MNPAMDSPPDPALTTIAAQAIAALASVHKVRCRYPSSYAEEEVVSAFRMQSLACGMTAHFLPDRPWTWVARELAKALMNRGPEHRRDLVICRGSSLPASARMAVASLRHKVLELERFELAAVSAEEILRLVNAARTASNAHPVQRSEALDRAAERHAADLSQRTDWSHRGSDGSLPRQRALQEGYRYDYVAENTAVGTARAEDLVAAWQASQRHRKNMLDAQVLHAGVSSVRLNRDHRPVVVLVLGGGAKRGLRAPWHTRLPDGLPFFR